MTSRRRERLGQLAVGLWAAACVFALATLSVNHVLSMPEPEEDAIASLEASLRALRRHGERAFVVHVIAADCSCTERLFAHLLAAGAESDAEELILFVGSDSARAAAAEGAGYRFRTLGRDTLERMGLEAAPVLAVLDAGGTLRYLGGYFDHPAAVTPLDRVVRNRLSEGLRPAPLPIYGCAVSTRLRESLDPLGLVYDRD